MSITPEGPTEPGVATPPTQGPTPPFQSATTAAPDLRPTAPRRRRWILPVAGALGCAALGAFLGFGLAKVDWPLSSPFPGALKTCDVANSAYFRLGDHDASLTVQSEGEKKAGADFAKVACVLRELGVPDSVVTRMDSTRALDGRQSAHWKDLDASWTYHPDNGMNLLVEVATR